MIIYLIYGRVSRREHCVVVPGPRLGRSSLTSSSPLQPAIPEMFSYINHDTVSIYRSSVLSARLWKSIDFRRCNTRYKSKPVYPTHVWINKYQSSMNSLIFFNLINFVPWDAASSHRKYTTDLWYAKRSTDLLLSRLLNYKFELLQQFSVLAISKLDVSFVSHTEKLVLTCFWWATSLFFFSQYRILFYMVHKLNFMK